MLEKQRKEHRRSGRSRYFPWLITLGCLILIARVFSATPSAARLGDFHSGGYQLQKINSDCSLVVRSAAQAEFTVHWLGIELTKHTDAHDWLKSSLPLHTEVELRLDRRRLDRQGHLQAYFFQHGSLLNEQLVKKGYAQPDTHPSDFAPIARRIQNAQPIIAER